MFCNKCGNELNDKHNFCTNCGAKRKILTQRNKIKSINLEEKIEIKQEIKKAKVQDKKEKQSKAKVNKNEKEIKSIEKEKNEIKQKIQSRYQKMMKSIIWFVIVVGIIYLLVQIIEIENNKIDNDNKIVANLDHITIVDRVCASELNYLVENKYVLVKDVKEIACKYDSNNNLSVYVEYYDTKTKKNYIVEVKNKKIIADTKNYNPYFNDKEDIELIEEQKEIDKINKLWNSKENLTKMNLNKIIKIINILK